MFKKKKQEELEDDQMVLTDELTVDLPDIAESAKKPKKKLPGWVILPILAVVVLIFIVGSKMSGASANSVAQLGTVAVETGDVKEVYSTSGTLESGKTKTFYSPVNAPVKTCDVKVGEAVKKGTVLVTFDTSTLEQDNKQSELNALATKYTNQDTVEQSGRSAQSAKEAQSQSAASVSSLKSQIQDKQKEVDKMQKALSASGKTAAKNAAKASEIQQKMQDNLDAQSEQKAIKENAERQLKNLDTGDKDYASLQDAAAKATDSISQLEIAYRKLENKLNAVGGTDNSSEAAALEAATQELKSLKASLKEMGSSSTGSSANTGITGAQQKNMEVSEELAELAQMSTEELLKLGKEGIKAEFDGVISDVQVLEGSAAVQGGQLFTLVSNKDVNVKLEVSASDYDKLKVGNEAEIKVGQNTYKGKLASVDKIALPNEKGNPVIGAVVHIDNPDEEICIGVSAKVSMTVAEKKEVLCLPNEVVNTSAEGDFVYIIKKGIVEKQMVELGVASGSMVEIVSGLTEGNQVISDVSGDVEEGMQAIGISGKE